jgi:hypothetical protein
MAKHKSKVIQIPVTKEELERIRRWVTEPDIVRFLPYESPGTPILSGADMDTVIVVDSEASNGKT